MPKLHNFINKKAMCYKFLAILCNTFYHALCVKLALVTAVNIGHLFSRVINCVVNLNKVFY